MKSIQINTQFVSTYLVTTVTSAIVFYVIVDQNTYFNNNGDKVLFEHAGTIERIVASAVMGWAYASLNAGLIGLTVFFHSKEDMINVALNTK
jgi:hypothetical protein